MHSVYGAWEPDDETGPYRFEIVFIVRSIEAMYEVRGRLAKTLGLHEHELLHVIDSVDLQFEVLVYDQVTLAELDERLRISEWDLLSGLMERV
ncbi:MAG: hypothetical protein KGI75_12120 [Rhizobiaceae bacterium]|nr:hypothetical protein [Rhizobiaceae bacterium]